MNILNFRWEKKGFKVFKNRGNVFSFILLIALFLSACHFKVEKPSMKNSLPIDSSLVYITEPVTKTVTGSFKVINTRSGTTKDTLLVDGQVGFDERGRNRINTRVTGRIVKLFVHYANQEIQKGQPLMVIYSPELVSAQRDLLQAKTDKDSSLLRQLKKKLLNMGMKENEIDQALKSEKPLTRITIYSPYRGISQQTESNAFTAKTELLSVREGEYVNKGQTVFSIQKIDKIWAVLNVFSENLRYIRLGDTVDMYADAQPHSVVKGQIDFIPPYRNQDEKTTRVRVYLNKLPDDWKVGMLLHGRLIIHNYTPADYIPLTAVNQLGRHQVVWVQDKNRHKIFHARTVKTGLKTGTSIEIISGISPNDKIVENAAYLVGSESFIK